MIRIVFIIFFQFAFVGTVLAQLDNSLFEDRKVLHPERSSRVYLGVDFLGFTRNNEYFNQIADGYTLFGYQFSPHLTYYPAENVRVDAGIFLHKDFGISDYYTVAPTFSVKIKRDKMQFVFGNLDGSLNHRLIEPLYDFERVMNDRLETGIQAIWNTDKTFLDLWINWETMIYPGDNKQEEVSGGFSLDYLLSASENFEVRLPVQTVLYHKGGQIDVSPAPLVSFMNNALGLSVRIPVSEAGFLRAFRTDNYYVHFLDFSFEKVQPYTSGSGIYLNLTAEFKNIDFMTSYWRGDEFISIKGAALYQSVSNSFKNPGYTEDQRELLIFRLMHNIKILDNLHLSSRFEPFYDLGNSKFEFSHGLYLNYRPDFYLFNVKEASYD